MKKIPSLFVRDWDNNPRFVTSVVDEECQWVIDGEGVPTMKWDGTAVMVRGGKLFKRYDVKKGREVPNGFEPSQEPDETTGHWPGWIPVTDGPEDKRHREVFDRLSTHVDGTYELVGPKVNGNPHKLEAHIFVKHGSPELGGVPATFNAIREYLDLYGKMVEGIVWHHSDGRMAKIKRKDFGLEWPVND